MIRKLEQSDINCVGARSFMEYFYNDRSVSQQKNFNYTEADIEFYMTVDNAIQLVYIENNFPIAYLLAFDMGMWGFLDVLIVSSNNRRRGIATNLLEYVISKNPQWNMLESSYYPTDDESASFFRRNSFSNSQNLIWVGKPL